MSSVLVVEDQADIRALLTKMLALEGHAVTDASGGREAMQCLRDEPFDVVILDIQMPDVDGWEVLSWIRSNPRTEGLPVVMCTVKGRADDLLRAWETGCDAFLLKPFDLAELSSTVEAVTGRTQAERSAARAQGLEDARRAARTGSI